MMEILAPNTFFDIEELMKLTNDVELATHKGTKTTDKDWMLTRFWLNTGLRSFEVADLLIRDVRIGREQAYIYVKCGKGDKARNVHLPPELKTHLKCYIKKYCEGQAYLFKPQRGEKYSPNGLWRWAVAIQAKSGIKKDNPSHVFRHTYASILMAKTRDPLLVQMQLGHASLRTTAKYMHIFDNGDLSQRLKGLYDLPKTRKSSAQVVRDFMGGVT